MSVLSITGQPFYDFKRKESICMGYEGVVALGSPLVLRRAGSQQQLWFQSQVVFKNCAPGFSCLFPLNSACRRYNSHGPGLTVSRQVNIFPCIPSVVTGLGSNPHDRVYTFSLSPNGALYLSSSLPSCNPPSPSLGLVCFLPLGLWPFMTGFSLRVMVLRYLRCAVYWHFIDFVFSTESNLFVLLSAASVTCGQPQSQSNQWKTLQMKNSDTLITLHSQ